MIGSGAIPLLGLLPRSASGSAERFDALFLAVLSITAFFFVLVTVTLVVFAIRYRRRSAAQQISKVKGDRRIEVVWTVVPAVIMLVLFVLGFRDYLFLAVPPANSLEVRVTGQQWSWSFDYPKEGINTGELVVPTGRAVKLVMSSRDVIHSFFVPAFRIKRDVLPNRYTILWFTATEPGTYDVLCAEYCGTAHSQMLTSVKVVSAQEYKAWVDSGGGMSGKGISSVEFGKRLFTGKGCASCHSVDGTRKIGPSLLKKSGAKETLSNGSTVTVDDNYLRESIMQPNAKVVQGYDPVMPTFAGRLTDPQTDALIDYIKSIGQGE